MKKILFVFVLISWPSIQAMDAFEQSSDREMQHAEPLSDILEPDELAALVEDFYSTDQKDTDQSNSCTSSDDIQEPAFMQACDSLFSKNQDPETESTSLRKRQSAVAIDALAQVFRKDSKKSRVMPKQLLQPTIIWRNQCPQCQHHFTTPAVLKEHILMIHEHRTRFRCIPCEFASDVPTNMIRHINSKKHAKIFETVPPSKRILIWGK